MKSRGRLEGFVANHFHRSALASPQRWSVGVGFWSILDALSAPQVLGAENAITAHVEFQNHGAEGVLAWRRIVPLCQGRQAALPCCPMVGRRHSMLE
jgi:hypothetical protein